jgi:hypothetical protein
MKGAAATIFPHNGSAAQVETVDSIKTVLKAPMVSALETIIS